MMKRRGLSTIVGAVFFVLVMGSTIGYVTYSLDLIDDLAYQVDAKQDTNLNRQNEEFKIVDVGVVNNEFNLTVKNTGTIPINITRMWAKNMTDPLFNQTNYQINQIVSPGGTIKNLGVGTGLMAMDSESYSLKLLTDRGNALETQVVSTTNQPLEMSLFATPASPLSGHNVTLMYTVKNNLTEGVIQSLTPQMSTSGTAIATPQGTVNPTSVQGLNPGETAVFEYTYEVSGSLNQIATFTASLVAGVPGNSVSDNVVVNIAPVSQQSINEAINSQIGIINMNYTTFEQCQPSTKDCRSNSNHWDRAWSITKNTSYLWRLTVTNNGLYDIILDEKTTLIGLPVKDGGGGNAPSPFFIKKDSTTVSEDPGAYSPNYLKTLVVGQPTVIYFGTSKAGQAALNPTDSNPGIVSVIVTFFGYEDRDASGSKTGPDEEYSQSIPFQAYSVT